MIMSSRFANTHSAALLKKPVPKAMTAILPAMRADAAATDKTKSDFSIFGDPLWGIAIVSGILFATLAALMAVG
jgi:hypothetical protein